MRLSQPMVSEELGDRKPPADDAVDELAPLRDFRGMRQSSIETANHGKRLHQNMSATAGVYANAHVLGRVSNTDR